MEMEGIIGFVLGFLADLFRAVFMPATTEWINRLIPAARRKVNIQENTLTLAIMEKLKSLGKDPDLVRHARDDVDSFIKVLTSLKETFVDNAVETIDSAYMTQAEMTAESGRQSDVALQQMHRAVLALERSGFMDRAQLKLLRTAQRRWETYAHAQAEFAAAEFAGGTIASVIYAGALEDAALTRTSELRRLLKELQEKSEN
jgi:uncharacterized protein YecT (DUF1311 family)